MFLRYVVNVGGQLTRQLVKHGGRQVNEPGFDVSAVTGGTRAVGAYPTKLQVGVETKRGVGQEVARGDLKRGRHKTRGMFEVLASFIATGDLDELAIWNEYEQATKGVNAVRWSNGLRARLGAGDEQTDEALAAAEVEGSEDVLTIGESTWHKTMRSGVRGVHVRVLREAERGWANGGRPGAVEVVTAYLHGIGITEPWVREWQPPVE